MTLTCQTNISTNWFSYVISEGKAASDQDKAEEKARADEAKARAAEEKSKVRLILFVVEF